MTAGALVLERSPEVDYFVTELHVHLVQVPPPVPEAPHAADPLTAYVAREHGSEPVPPQPDRLMADVDAALEQQVLYVPQGEREPHVHHHHEPDHLG
jgi:hypothetical protein